MLAAVAAYAVAVLANPTAAGPTCLAAFLTGVLVAEPAPTPERPWPRRGLTAVLVAGTLAMATCCVAEVQLGTAVDEARAGHADEAASALDGAQRWRPWDSDIALLGAEASLGSDPERARDLAEEALRDTPDSFEALVTLGLAELAVGDEEGGRRHLDRAAELFPERPVRRP